MQMLQYSAPKVGSTANDPDTNGFMSQSAKFVKKKDGRKKKFEL